jgi:hypothetical protein
MSGFHINEKLDRKKTIDHLPGLENEFNVLNGIKIYLFPLVVINILEIDLGLPFLGKHQGGCIQDDLIMHGDLYLGKWKFGIRHGSNFLKCEIGSDRQKGTLMGM